MRVVLAVLLVAAACEATDLRRTGAGVDASITADLLSPDLAKQEAALKKLQAAQARDEKALKETEKMLAKEFNQNEEQMEQGESGESGESGQQEQNEQQEQKQKQQQQQQQQQAQGESGASGQQQQAQGESGQQQAQGESGASGASGKGWEPGDEEQGDKVEVGKVPLGVNQEQEQHKSEPKQATKRAIQRLKDWSRPKTVPMGHYENAANGLEDIPNDKWNNVTNYKPMMVPRGAFKAISNPTTAAPKSVRPQMVGYGALERAALEKVWQEGNITEAIRLEKEGKFKEQELRGACSLMEQTRSIAVAIHREESSSEGKALPSREGVLSLMKIVCPVLKLTYPYVTRCIKCAVLENMLKRWYDPKYEGKTYPGFDSPQRCNEGGWPTKNFAIATALLDNRNLFGTNACENMTKTEMLGAPQQQQEQGESGASGAAAEKKGFPHPLWSNNPAAPVGSKWDGATIKGSISEADPAKFDKGDTSRILV